jgi:hypothetical protein
VGHTKYLMFVIAVEASICALRLLYLHIPEGEVSTVGYAQRFEAEPVSLLQ